MSDLMKFTIGFAGLSVIVLGSLGFELRTTNRRTDEQRIARLLPRSARVLDERGQAWLARRIDRRRRWSGVLASVVMLALFPVGFVFRDSVVLSESWYVTHGLIGLVLGSAVGGTLASTRSCRVESGPHRVTTLRPRLSSTYLRRPELRLQTLHTGMALLACAAAIASSLYAPLSTATTWFLLALTTGWLGAIVLLRWALRRTLQAPPSLADERLSTARELMIAIAVRDTFGLEGVVFALMYLFVTSFLSIAIAGFSMVVAVLPIYVVACALALTRAIRRDRGKPDPLWHFARTVGSTA